MTKTTRELALDLKRLIEFSNIVLEGVISTPAVPGQKGVAKLRFNYRGVERLPFVAVRGCDAPGQVQLRRGTNGVWYGFGYGRKEIYRSERSSRDRPRPKKVELAKIKYLYEVDNAGQKSLWVGGFQEESVFAMNYPTGYNRLYSYIHNYGKDQFSVDACFVSQLTPPDVFANAVDIRLMRVVSGGAPRTFNAIEYYPEYPEFIDGVGFEEPAPRMSAPEYLGDGLWRLQYMDDFGSIIADGGSGVYTYTEIHYDWLTESAYQAASQDSFSGGVSTGSGLIPIAPEFNETYSALQYQIGYGAGLPTFSEFSFSYKVSKDRRSFIYSKGRSERLPTRSILQAKWHNLDGPDYSYTYFDNGSGVDDDPFDALFSGRLANSEAFGGKSWIAAPDKLYSAVYVTQTPQYYEFRAETWQPLFTKTSEVAVECFLVKNDDTIAFLDYSYHPD